MASPLAVPAILTLKEAARISHERIVEMVGVLHRLGQHPALRVDQLT
jgi:hypothetical protein